MESPPLEILSAVDAQWAARWAPILGVAALVAVVAARLGRTPRWRWLAGVLVGVGCAWGLFRAAHLAWLADDAFISFRYAKHFALGDGLVFNAGERVEGYTNFLLVVLLGAAKRLGADIPHVALVVNALSFVALVWLAAALSSERESLGFPWAALAVAVARPFHVFATSGLETGFALALAALGVWRWRRGALVSAGVLLGLAALARPDHVLLAGATWVVAFVTAERGARRRVLTQLVAPGLALFTAWWLWRWWYYADFFPNTFHAKSGGTAYWEQGATYLTHGLFASGVVLALPLVVVAPLLVRRKSNAGALVLLALAVAGTHGVYVTRVGGDFMEYRFLLPSLYFLLVAWGAVLNEVQARAPRRATRALAVTLGALCLAVVGQETRPVGPGEKRWHLAEEESFWPVERLWPLTVNTGGMRLGRDLRAAFAGVDAPPRIAMGVIGTVGYESMLPIEDIFGLTSARVGHKPLTKRGRPGHEKLATPDELYAAGAVFSIDRTWPGTALELVIAGHSFWLLRHDPALQQLARARGWRYPDLDAAVQAAADSALTVEALAAMRATFEKVLRGTPGAEARLARLTPEVVVAAASTGPVALADVAPRLRRLEAFAGRSVADALQRRVVLRVDFEGALPPGVATSSWAATAGTAPNQSPVDGFQGRKLLNGYAGGDAATGRFEVDLSGRGGEWLDFLVGGGSGCTAKYVALRDGAREVGRWCGAQSEHLRRVSVSLAGLAEPRLVLVDEDTGGWGHLLLDDVVVVRGERSVLQDAGGEATAGWASAKAR